MAQEQPAEPSAWMERLPDGAYIDQLSIPGTHDSGTGNGTKMDSFARTQELTLTEQFNAGIRAFDLRPSVKGDEMIIYHGVVETNISFPEALQELAACLEANPTEFIIIVMRHEDDHESSTEKEKWNGLMADCLAESPAAARMATFSSTLTVADMRGKILLLSRDRYATKPVGGFISNWTHSADFAEQGKASITAGRGSAKLHVQDFYETNNAMDTKLSAITTLLDHSTTLNTTTGHNWVINHTSGYSATLFATADAYRKNAAETNRAVIDYLADENHAGPTGLIVMDFAGTDTSGSYTVNGAALTNAVIENNFRYKMNGEQSGVSEVSASPSDIEVTCSNGTITAETTIEIYNIAGEKIAGGFGHVTVSTPGIYIVRAGNTTRKIIVR